MRPDAARRAPDATRPSNELKKHNENCRDKRQVQEQVIGAPSLVSRHPDDPIPSTKNKQWHSQKLNRDITQEARPRASAE